LKVNGVEVFGVDDVLAWERKNQRWSYALFVCALFAVLYFGVRRYRVNGPTNRPWSRE
jgi:hypothetical protein